MFWNLPRRTLALVSGLVTLVLVVVIVATAFILTPGPRGGDSARSRATTSTPTTPVLPSPSPTALPAGNDWTMYRYAVTGTGVNPEGSITTSNVAQLTLHWSNAHVQGYHPIESTPAELDGIVYFTSGHELHALDLATGKELWYYRDPFASKEIGTLFSSVAIDPQTQLAYYGGGDGHLYAVDTRTGKGVWSVALGEKSIRSFTWSSPLLVNGNVYIGIASLDDNPCVRGGVFALNPATGVTIWSHYTARAGELGGGVWSSVSADPATHEIIATSANPCDAPAGTEPQTGAVDAQQESFIAMDWNTGATVWHYAVMQYDSCDCGFPNGPVNFTYQGTKYVVAGNKNGVEYAIIPPSTRGGSPTVAWTVQLARLNFYGSGGVYEPATYGNGMIYVASGPTPDGACPHGAVWALRAASGARVWRQCTVRQVVSASMLTGGVLFVPVQDHLMAYSAASGQVLWKASQPGKAWGGVSLARGFVLSGSVAGTIYCYSLPGHGRG